MVVMVVPGWRGPPVGRAVAVVRVGSSSVTVAMAVRVALPPILWATAAREVPAVIPACWGGVQVA